ncbi:MAG TPA: type II secretion system F family protein, partial [Candidatus Saccharibacteria bacterium]|nr:type II secretion system F family protein [Candidatus Saccharibacteria bacterium]
MLTFVYSARDTATNKIVKSTVQADSEGAAAKLLMSRNLVPINIVPEADKANFLDKLKNRVGTKDRVIFSRQLATLINAGLPLTQSLHTVQEQTTNAKLKGIIQDITSSVEGGKTLADSFAQHDIFGDLYIALIAAGEVSGTLDKALERIADQQEKDAEIVSKVRGAMVYPAIVLVVILLVIMFMLTTVVPQIETLYDSMNKELPFLTNIMVQTGNFVSGFGGLVLLAVVGVGFFFLNRHAKTETGRRQMDTLKVNMPLFGDLFRKLYMARFCRTGETLLQSGVQMLEMLRIAGRSVGNVLVKDSID